MTEQNAETRPLGRRGARFLVTALCLVVVGAVLWQLLPRGSFPADLSQIGEGQPALVMMREVNIMGGERVVDLMLEVHPEFEDEVLFRVTQDGVPEGREFASEYNVSDGQLVLFDGQGQVIDRMGRPESAEQLRSFVAQAVE